MSLKPPSSQRPVLWTNPLTLLGLVLIGLGLLMLVTFWLFLVAVPKEESNQYLGMVGFMILPNVLIAGLALCPVGIALQRRKFRRDPKFQFIPVRRALQFIAVTFFLIIPVLGVCSYRGYLFTESAEFCGAICHNMLPQYTRYQQSPHARVTCAGCHIGPGAGFFVKSKISGLRQVAYTMLNVYPRPIPPAITQLRPASETCEQCHWPNQFFGSLLRTIVHFAPDQENTRHAYQILIKVGGLNNALGQAEGIHMHMLNHVEYVASDSRLEHIPWVRYTFADGHSVVFRSDGKPFADPPPPGQRRNLDCIDCHNTIGHEFLSPDRAVDHALTVGRLDPSLPYLKREAVYVLVQKYSTKPQALAAIQTAMEAFYRARPDVWPARWATVQRCIKAVQAIYRANFFPDMHVDWRTYPDHIGHMESPGCFRCHDGLHVSASGARISSSCTTCHTFQYRQANPSVIVEKTFEHPLKINNAWKDLGPHEAMLCTDCHDGGLAAEGWTDTQSIYACGDCHPSGRWLLIRKTLRIRRMAATQPSSW
jgi:NapC/NirT cytochrome c family, N-terminal region